MASTPAGPGAVGPRGSWSHCAHPGPRPRDPKEIPDFYGYGSDITVNLDTGERLERPGTRMPWVHLRDLWAILLALTCGPFVIAFELLSGRWNWRRGSLPEADNDDR